MSLRSGDFFGGGGPLAWTPSGWSYESSDNKTGSILLVSGGWGNLYLRNGSQRMTIPYYFGAVGPSAGLDLGFSFSDASYLGIGGLYTLNYMPFSQNLFPCEGMIFSGGACAIDGVGVTIFRFGITSPWGWIPTAGAYFAVGAGVGLAGGVIRYQGATITDVPDPVDDSVGEVDFGGGIPDQ